MHTKEEIKERERAKGGEFVKSSNCYQDKQQEMFVAQKETEKQEGNNDNKVT